MGYRVAVYGTIIRREQMMSAQGWLERVPYAATRYPGAFNQPLPDVNNDAGILPTRGSAPRDFLQVLKKGQESLVAFFRPLLLDPVARSFQPLDVA